MVNTLRYMDTTVETSQGILKYDDNRITQKKKLKKIADEFRDGILHTRQEPTDEDLRIVLNYLTSRFRIDNAEPIATYNDEVVVGATITKLGRIPIGIRGSANGVETVYPYVLWELPNGKQYVTVRTGPSTYENMGISDADRDVIRVLNKPTRSTFTNSNSLRYEEEKSADDFDVSNRLMYER